jgi:hypothetical protein
MFETMYADARAMSYTAVVLRTPRSLLTINPDQHVNKGVFLCIYRFTCAVVYYGTSLNVGDLSGSRHFNFFLCGLVEIPALYVVIFTNNR